MKAEEQVATAKRWADRMDIGGWPTIWRVDDISEPDITVGDRDVVTIPSVAISEADVVAVVLAYAYHNVPAESKPDDQQLQAAALELAAAWQEAE